METFIQSTLTAALSVNISRLRFNLRSNIGAVWECTLSASHCTHPERLAGMLCLVLCQGCTEETAWLAEMGLRDARGLFTVNCWVAYSVFLYVCGSAGEWGIELWKQRSQAHRHINRVHLIPCDRCCVCKHKMSHVLPKSEMSWFT